MKCPVLYNDCFLRHCHAASVLQTEGESQDKGRNMQDVTTDLDSMEDGREVLHNQPQWNAYEAV